jgi:hypothetical protein
MRSHADATVIIQTSSGTVPAKGLPGGKLSCKPVLT